MLRRILIAIFLLFSVLSTQGQEEPAVYCQPGPWGRIEYHFIYLAVPNTILDNFPMPAPITRWCFKGHNSAWVHTFLASIGLDTTAINRLTNDPRSAPDEEGVITLFPTEEDVLGLSPANCLTLCKELAQYTENPFYHDPVCVPDGDVDGWLRGTDIPKNVVELIRKLVYRNGEGYFFSDLRLVLKYAQSDTEARNWVKALTRIRAVIATLHVDSSDDLPTLRRYWSANFHRADSLPMLDAVAQNPHGATLDITHLLPLIPRQLVYSYVSPNTERTGQTPNCHWTSLNFFNYTRQNILLDLKLASSHVLDDYEMVSPPYSYGDVLFFLNAQGDAFHSCVFVADNLVFTKNGENEMIPWVLTRLDDVKQLYSREPNYKIQGFRRKWPEGG